MSRADKRLFFSETTPETKGRSVRTRASASADTETDADASWASTKKSRAIATASRRRRVEAERAMARRAAEREREGIDPPPAKSPARTSESAASTPSRSPQARVRGTAEARTSGKYPDAYPASYAEGRLVAARRLLADLETGEPLAFDSVELAELRETSRRVVAKVRAYRSAVESPPDRDRRGRARGEAIPAHERYAHYKMRGFGGMGAKTSWAK